MAIREPARVTAVLGPTNTGKTHLAIERLCAHSSGIMGFPLRLLAREVYDRVVAIKGPNEVGLITGEEKIMPPAARWILSTVESMPLDRDVAFVAIDESQLGADPERGHIFTDRILNNRGRDETMILGSDSLKPLVRSLLPEAEIISRPRFSSLEFAGSKKLTRLPPRSAVIGFSADEVYAAAELLRRTHGGAAVVMGALSPGTRNAQVALYQSGEVDYIVATDAIGMGLNLDIGHICFAGLTKFDGKRRRRLTVAELAQIAGRAGRHHRNGTFGTASGFGPVPELTPDEIERIENHRFRPLDHLFWRNPNVDLSSPTALLASLSDLPDKPGLRLSPRAIDEEVLDLMVSHPSIAARRWNEADMSRLWSACRVPDFMKRGAEFHAGFVARLWDHLGKGNGTIPTQWIATELARLDSVQGDIDTLSTRIAASRSWAFIAHQADWVDDPPHWAARTQALEAKLSDALHKKLTERFVDRRARLLRARDGQSPNNVNLTVHEKGQVTLNGETIGTLAGFEFRPDPVANHAELKALVAAAEDKLRPELVRRAAQLAAAKNGEISLAIDDKGQALIAWREAPVARLSKGRALLDPAVILLPSLRLLPTSDRERALCRVRQWLRSRVDQKMGRLRWLSRAARSPDHPPAIRAILAALADGLGHCEREKLADAVQDLIPAQRHWLRTAGVTIGPLDLYVEAQLKPGAAAMSLLLRCVAEGKPVLSAPMAGLGIIDKPSAHLSEAARLTGYRTFGEQMIRIDLVNRIALDLHKQRSGSDSFEPDARLATSMGIGVATMNRVLRSLGFRPTDALPGQWRWRGLNRPKKDTRPINPSFAVLESLKKA